MSALSLNVIFMGTPEFSVPALQAIIRSTHKVVCVYSQPPRGRGRGYTVQKSPVHEAAEGAGIEVRNPLSLKKDPAAQAEFCALGADIAIVAAYGLILPKAVLDAPRYGCVNIHASLLPRWRGASPIQRAIWSGDEQSGITLMQMEEGLDTGPVIERGVVPMTRQTDCTSLHDALSSMGGAMIVPFLDRIAQDKVVKSAPQSEEGVTYASMLHKNDGRVDWKLHAVEIDRQIRALNPWPGVWAMAGGKRLKILEASPVDRQESSAPGTIIDRDGSIACGGNSVLRLLSLQPENSRRMDMASAINGKYLAAGMKLE